ncbi:MAG: PLP-dependent transferase, partial [Thiohalomonadales bacterium]
AVVRSGGACMSPFNAWVFLKGLETLPLRMQAHCDNASKLALWLTKQTQIETVYYPELVDHPGHELAKKQQSRFGAIVSFDVSGGQENAWRLIDNTKMLSITANLGDTKTTITHPATTTHGRLTTDERVQAGISDGLVRIAVGLENIEDIIEDIKLS